MLDSPLSTPNAAIPASAPGIRLRREVMDNLLSKVLRILLGGQDGNELHAIAGCQVAKFGKPQLEAERGEFPPAVF